MTPQLKAQTIDALQNSIDVPCYGGHPKQEAALAALRAEPDVQPVGWMYIEATYNEGDLRGRQWKFHQFSRTKPDRSWMQRDVVALYDHPAPQSAVPLTDDQIYEMYNEPRSDAEMLEFARAIEAAHGITQPKAGE
jgi:hypothetical protein